MTRIRIPRGFLAGCLVASFISFVEPIHAQAPATQPVPARAFQVPPAPVLSPQEEMKTFKIVPGYRMELLASEPLVIDPVSMSFDADGRIWVCEMRGFMTDIDNTGSNKPVGTVSVLEDTNGDGIFDKTTLFLDGLVLPRSVLWTSDGVIVSENGNVWLCHDTNGDFKCDKKELLFQYNRGNVEHSFNGLMPGLDNWVYNANDGIRLRKVDGKWITDATAPRGQWGITQDNQGYLVYNVNAQLIRGDLVPSYSANAHYTNPMLNVVLYKDQIVWPIRPNTGINRGYIDTYLRPDGTMIEANADCGPVIYRGDNLPKELVGNCFINEPAGNLIRRQVFVEDNGVKSSKNAYDKVEFLASTDERFRPVNMYNAPDGTIYVIDMYRGVIQDGAYVTPFLRQEILSRDLDKNIGLGRIYRIVHDTTQPRKPVALSKASNAELVAYLASPNGWHRDMAQRLLVERNDPSVVPAIRKMATSSDNPLGRLHALWTLDGIKKLDEDTLVAMLADKDAAVRGSAVSLGRNRATQQRDSFLVDRIAALAKDPDANVRMQVVFALGQIDTETADRAVEPFLKEAAANPTLLESFLAGFAGREVEFLASRVSLSTWANPEPWRQKLLSSSSNLLWRQRQPLPILRLMHLVGGRPEAQAWQQVALLEGLSAPPPAAARGGRGRGGAATPRIVNLPAAPEAIETLQKSPNPQLATAAENLAKQLNWPGKDGKPLPVLPPLSVEQQALYDLGRREYMNLCAGCHHPAGFGDAGKGPPLLDSDWLENENRVVSLVLHGLRGPVNINGETFNREGVLEMPAMRTALDDQKIAGVLTFVRREWRENAKPIDPATVTRIRTATSDRVNQWSEKELLEIK